MQILNTAACAALGITLAAVSLSTAHAAFPGENGVIVYSSLGRLWKVADDGTTTRIESPQYLVNPAVSPNGKQLAAMSLEANNMQSLRVMNLDGGDPVVIDQFGVIDQYSAPAWSPDGKTLTLMDVLGNVFLYDVATLGKRTLVANMSTARPSGRMSWSPLGDRIAGDALTESWWIDVASGQVSKFPSLVYPDWLPDYGGRVVGISNAADQSYGCLVRMAPDGSDRVTFPGCNFGYPTVSPDGTALLVSNLSSAGFKLSVRDFQGQSVQSIAPQADKRADWSRVPMTAMRTTLTNSQWSAPAPLANDSDTYTSQSAMAVMPDHGSMGGALRRALGIGPDGRVYERAQGTNGKWGAWVKVPGIASNPVGGIVAKQVAIAGARDGSLQVVIVGSNDLVYHAMRYTSGAWSGFGQLDGYGGAANFAARDVAIGIVNSSTSAPGQAHVVANGKAAGEVFHRVRLDSGNWTPWGSLGNPSTGSLALAFAGNADLYVLATTPTGMMRTLRHPSGTWDGWVNVSQVPDGGLRDVSLAITSSVSTGVPVLAHVVYAGADGQVAYQLRYAPGFASSWANPPEVSMPVMPNGRSVSVVFTPGSALELVAVQAQPQ